MSAPINEFIPRAGADETIDDYSRTVDQVLLRALEIERSTGTPFTPSALMPIGGMLCHKYHDLLTSMSPTELILKPVEQQAKYADLCGRYTARREQWAREQLAMLEQDPIDLSKINATSVGNCAYLYLHADSADETGESTTALRQLWLAALERFRALSSSQV